MSKKVKPEKKRLSLILKLIKSPCRSSALAFLPIFRTLTYVPFEDLSVMNTFTAK